MFRNWFYTNQVLNINVEQEYKITIYPNFNS